MTSGPSKYQSELSKALRGAMSPMNQAKWEYNQDIKGDPTSLFNQPLGFDPQTGRYTTTYSKDAVSDSISFKNDKGSLRLFGSGKSKKLSKKFKKLSKKFKLPSDFMVYKHKSSKRSKRSKRSNKFSKPKSFFRTSPFLSKSLKRTKKFYKKSKGPVLKFGSFRISKYKPKLSKRGRKHLSRKLRSRKPSFGSGCSFGSCSVGMCSA
jgi:hypothetical protein